MCSTSLCDSRLGSLGVRPPPGRATHRVATAILLLAGATSAPALVGGCNPQSTYLEPITAPSPRQEAASPLTVSLRYRDTSTLAVRRRDEHGAIQQGVPVSFTITGDSGGSALAQSRTTTDAAGVAKVMLTAGSQASTFHVEATSESAEKVVFEVVVSRSQTVDVAVRLAYQEAGQADVRRVRALFYTDLSCADLDKLWGTQQPAPEPWRQQYVPVRSALLEFKAIPPRAYAVVGIAEDKDDRAIARGCVDLLDAQLGAGGYLELPVPLTSVVPVLAEAYVLDSTLDLSGLRGIAPAWDRLASCPLGFAESLLDALVASLDGQVAAALEAHRTPVDMNGCRPELDGGVPTLDAQLHQLLWKQNGSLDHLPSVAKDLQAIMKKVRLGSRLVLTPRDNAHYFASHALTRIAFEDAAGQSHAYDPGSLGLPVTSLDAITADFDGTSFYLQPHGLTLRLPWLWGHALVDLALAPRALPLEIRALVADVVAQAARQDGNARLAGCAAVESLLCKGFGGGPCTLDPACRIAVDNLALALESRLIPAGGIDITLGGRATAVDGNHDRLVEALDRGELDVVLGLQPGVAVTVPGTFTGSVAPIP